jgi:hypothetical protein
MTCRSHIATNQRLGACAGGSSAEPGGPTDPAFVWSNATGMLALPVPGAASYADGRSLAHEIEGETVVGESAPDANAARRATVWQRPFQQAFHPADVPSLRCQLMAQPCGH